MINQKQYIDDGTLHEILHVPTAAYLEYWHLEDMFFKNKIKRGSRVLDVGCGEGRTITSIASHVGKHGSVVGIDFHVDMVTCASSNTEAFSNVELILMDARDIDKKFQDEEFHYIIFPFDFLGLLPKEDQAPTLQKATAKLMNKNSQILATVFSEYAAPYQFEMYQQLWKPDTIRADGNFVYADASAYAAERFSKKKLMDIFSKAGFKPEIKTLCKMAYSISAFKPYI